MLGLPFRVDITGYLGCILILALLVFSPLLEGGTTHLATMIIRLLILSAFSVYMVQIIGTRILLMPRTAVVVPILLFLILVVISTCFSPYVNQSEQWLLVCVGYAGLLYLLAAFMRQWEHWAVLYRTLVVIALFESGLALYQYAIEGTPRPNGTFFNPNFLAGYLAAIFVAVLASTCYAKTWHRRFWSTWESVIHHSLPILLLLILLSAILLTGSRGATVALVAGTAVVIGVRFGRHGLLGLVLLSAAVVLIPNPIRDRALAEHQQNPVTYARWQMWEGAVQEMTEHPLGAGLGLYQYVYPRHAVSIDSELFRYGKTAHNAHNEYLQIGVELGVAGIGVFVWGILLLGRETVFLLRQRLTRRQRTFALGAGAGMVVILTHAAIDSNLREPAIAIVLACYAGMVFFGRTMEKNGGQGGHSAVMLRTPRLWASLGVLIIIAVGIHVFRLGVAYQIHDAGADLVKQRQLEQAIDKFQEAIRLDPGKALYHNSLAGTYFQVYRLTHDVRMVQASLDELHAAIALNPLDGRLRSLLGHVLVSAAATPPLPTGGVQRDQLIGQAAMAYEQAAELEPFVYGHRMELAKMMLWLGRRGEAEKEFMRVIELEPNFLPAREALARLCMKSGKTGRAEEEHREIVARQRQFGSRVTNQVEREFLHVDTAALEAFLAEERSAT